MYAGLVQHTILGVSKMALVSAGFVGNIEFTDTGGNTTTRRYALTSATAGAAATDMAAIMAAVGAITDAVISGYSVGERFVEAALVYPANAEVENQAQFSGKIVGFPNKSAVVSVPAPAAAIFTSPTGPGYNIVNIGFGAVQTFLLLFDGSGPVQVSDGESWVVTSVRGRRVHQKSIRG